MMNISRHIHPLAGRRVVAVLPHGFIHVGVLHDLNGRYMLTDASNLRYWQKRDRGLTEFAEKGPISGDRIDSAGDIYIETVLFFYITGDWS